jgi:putative nucleotidyltransferase with HDIG domain
VTLDERNWLGDPAAETRKKRVPESAAARAARMHGARPFPAAAAKILTLTSREDFDVGKVVYALESDAPMAARVLRVVNSAVFGLRSKVTSIKQAVTLLGAKGVREATIAGSVLNLFPGKKTEVWTALHAHATLAGALARHLAEEWNLPADEMFIGAFLHDIGKWILLEDEPDYEAVLVKVGSNFEGTLEEERGTFGFDHAELGEHMLTAWALPQPVPRMVGLHHDPSGALEDSGDMALRVSLLRLVDRLAHAIQNNEEVDFKAFVVNDYCAYLGVTATTLRDRFAALRTMYGTNDDSGIVASPMRLESLPKLRAASHAEAASGVIEIVRGDHGIEPPSVSDDRCAACEGSVIKARCPRCAEPYCVAHAPARGQNCMQCDASFNATMNNSTLHSLRLGVVLAIVGFAAFAAAPWVQNARRALIATSIFFIFTTVLIALRRLALRQLFSRGG